MEQSINPNLESMSDEAIFQLANQLADQRKNESEIIDVLVKSGVPVEHATNVAEKVMAAVLDQPEELVDNSYAANKNILWGALWFLGGLIVTMITYSNASSGGGRYVVAWGAIVFGGIQLFRGLIQKSSNN